MKQSKLLNNVQKLKLPMLLTLGLMLTGCAHNSTVCPPASPALPTAPSVTLPTSHQTYSERASANIREWQQKLNSTPLMSDY